MSRLVITNNLTLDGVMQSPSHPDEDRRGGFEHGGWAPPYAAVLNGRRKYVVSTTLGDPLPWANSTLLSGVEEVASLKEEPGGDIVVLGSGELIASLMRRDLIDEYVLSIHPLVLGSGRRLFPEGSPYAKLDLVDSVTTTTGVVIGTFRPQR